jgi:hypothetical protein
MWWLQRSLTTGPALCLEDDTLIYKQGAFTRRIPLSRVARITEDSDLVVLLDDADKRITTFNRKHYDDLSWLCALKPAGQPSSTANQETDSMKKTFFISLGVGFGVTVGILLSVIFLYSMGGVRNDILGNLVIVPGATSNGTLDDYEKEAAATKALVISEVKWVRQGEELGVTFTAKNVMNYALNNHVNFQLVFLRGDDLKGISSEYESIAVPANGTANLVLQIGKNVPADFDVLRITTK